MDIALYKKILKCNNMTYNDLASKTGLSLGCVKRIMAGIAKCPRMASIEAIERALGISTTTIPADLAAFTVDEIALIGNYRKLSDQNKSIIKKFIKVLIE